MSHINFFDSLCSITINHEKFGICDDGNTTPAYIKLNNEENWIAIISNRSNKQIIFTAIDNCIEIKRDNGEMDKRCDAMIRTDDCIIFIELKNKLYEWKTDGFAQLENTIIKFIENNENYYAGFRYKKAFVANKKHRDFGVIDNEMMKIFYKKYKIRLNSQALITI
jgi:hypothetical protein